jgi:two-component system, OmpR family, phosphate regulon sensor histidine kinase PhoR
MWRFLEVIVWQLAGVVMIVFVAFQLNLNLNFVLLAVVGALIGVLIWVFINFSRSRRFLDWVRFGDLSNVPKLNGVWGEATDRTRRLLRDQARSLNQQ